MGANESLLCVSVWYIDYKIFSIRALAENQWAIFYLLVQDINVTLGAVSVVPCIITMY